VTHFFKSEPHGYAVHQRGPTSGQYRLTCMTRRGARMVIT